MRRRSRIPILILMASSLLVARQARVKCLDQRVEIDPTRRDASGNVSQLNSYALGLVLGGLRGPMLMALWTTSENQKNDRDLEDFDTKVEMIRLLQAEFDGVHLFQIWNKAFNISVQMSNVATKYLTILDAMQYARNVDKERPANINIISEIGRLYFDKFGGAAERAYYSPRLMDETLPTQGRVKVIFDAAQKDSAIYHARLAGASNYALTPMEADDKATQYYIVTPKSVADYLKEKDTSIKYSFVSLPERKANPTDQKARLTAHPVLLDADNRLLPENTAPKKGFTSEDDPAVSTELPYLKQFEPYPLGVSPYGLAYNYFKKSQWLQENRGERHSQVSDRIISVRPAMSLKKWSEESWYAGRRNEIEIFYPKTEIPKDDSQLEPITQDLPLSAKANELPLLKQVIWRYQNSASLCDATVDEFGHHLLPSHYPEDAFTYRSHIAGSRAQAKLVLADSYYLQAIVAIGDKKIELAEKARENYQLAANLYTRHIFQYFMGDEDVPDVFPRDSRNLTRDDVEPHQTKAPLKDKNLDDSELPLALAKLKLKHVVAQYQLPNSIDFTEINSYVERSYARIDQIDKFLGK